MKFLCCLCLLLLLAWSALAHSEQAPLAAAHSDMASMKTALDAFKVDCGRFPSTAEGWDALIHCPANRLATHWRGPYLNAIPIDPWGGKYVYACPGQHNTSGYDLYSCGADGISKSQGSDVDDINNWDPSSPRGGSASEVHPRRSIERTFWGNLVMFALAVWWSAREGTTKVKRPVNQRQWAGMVAVLWFAQGLGWAIYGNASLDIFPRVTIIIVLAWWIIGVALAISGMRSRSMIGVLTGSLAIFEFIYLLWASVRIVG